jgi:chemotaxis protein methyltransferase CheR
VNGAAGATGPGGYAEAQALYRAGSYLQAADLALAGIEAGEEPASAWELAARAYANIGSFAKARECCEKAIALDRINPQSHYLLSIILEQSGDSDAAVRSLKHVLFIDHDYLLAYVALGNLNLQCGNESESDRNFAIALRLLERRDPNDLLPEGEGMTAGSLARIIRGRLKG